MNIPITIADKYQEFFNFMIQEHDLVLTIDEMNEIIFEVGKLQEKLIEDEEDFIGDFDHIKHVSKPIPPKNQKGGFF